MKKKFCSALLLFAALIAVFHIPAWASETDNRVLASGECGASGNDVTWTLYRDYRVIVSGAGKMRDYSGEESLPWYGYRNQIKAVTIEEGVTTLGDNAFRGCSVLEKVSLPEGLTSIGNVSFYECAKLAEVNLPNSVETIGKNAFGYCALTEIAIPAGVSEIGASAFFKCSALTRIEVDVENENYSSVDGVLFDKIDASISGEGEEAPPDKSLLIWYPSAKSGTEYVVPDGITKIGDYAFQSASNLKKVTLPSGVTEIGEWAFSYNPNLTDMSLPKTLTNVKDGVKEYGIKDYAFYECTGLSTDDGEYGTGEISFEGSRQDWADMKIGTGNYRLTNAKVVPADMKQDNVVASGECGALGSNASWSLSKEGELLISGTGEMLSYRNAASVPWAHYKDASAAEDEEEKDLRADVKTVVIEGSVTEALNDKGEMETVKKGITNIGDYAFYDCVNLEKAELPPTLETIGTYAFADCAKLTLSEAGASKSLSKTAVKAIGDYAFSGCDALSELTFPNTLETIGKRAFLRSGLTSVTLPASVEDIGEWAFRWCDKLESLTMEPLDASASAHYGAIGSYAFANCAALHSVSFTENLTVIGEYAFSKCSALVSVAIPASVSEIGLCAFYSCPALTGVVVNEDNQSYASAISLKDEEGNYQKDEQGNLVETQVDMLLNKDLTCIFFYPIARQSASCAIPETVTSVAAFAFDGVTNLTDVHYYGIRSQWNNVSVGKYNAPLQFVQFDETGGHTADNAVTLHWEEGVDPDKETRIDAFTVEETEEGRAALVTVHCGDEALGAEALCAFYDADGRFLGIQAQEVAPGADEDFSFALPEQAASVRLFVTDGNRLPLCLSQTWPNDAA